MKEMNYNMKTKNEFIALYGSGIKTVKQLKKRYKELAKVYHPDVYGSSEMFNKIKDLYDEYKNKLGDYKLIKFTLNDIVNNREFCYDNIKITLNSTNIKKKIIEYGNKKFKLKYIDKEFPMRFGKKVIFIDAYMKITPKDFYKDYIEYNLCGKDIEVSIPKKGELCYYHIIKQSIWIKLNFEVTI